MAKTSNRRNRFQRYSHPKNEPKYTVKKRLGVFDSVTGTNVTQVGAAQSRYEVNINGSPLSLASSGGFNVPFLKNSPSYPVYIESNSELYDAGPTENFVFCLTERDPDDRSIITKTIIYSFDGTFPKIIHTFYSNATFQFKANSVVYASDHRAYIIAGTNAIDETNMAFKFDANAYTDVSAGMPSGRILDGTYGFFDKKFYWTTDDGSGGFDVIRYDPIGVTWETVMNIAETPVSIDSSWYNRKNIHIATSNFIYEYSDVFGLIIVFTATSGYAIRDFDDNTVNDAEEPAGLSVVEISTTTNEANFWVSGFFFGFTVIDGITYMGFFYQWVLSSVHPTNYGQVILAGDGIVLYTDTTDTTKTVSLAYTNGEDWAYIYTGRSSDGSTVGSEPFYPEGDLRFCVGYVRSSTLRERLIIFIPHDGGIDMWGTGWTATVRSYPGDSLSPYSFGLGIFNSETYTFTATTITDTIRTFLSGAGFADLTGYYIRAEDNGSSNGLYHQIISNTSDTITISGWLSTPPSNSTYYISYISGVNSISELEPEIQAVFFEKTFPLEMTDDDHFIIGGTVAKIIGN